jgi:hypothetical protein
MVLLLNEVSRNRRYSRVVACEIRNRAAEYRGTSCTNEREWLAVVETLTPLIVGNEVTGLEDSNDIG